MRWTLIAINILFINIALAGECESQFNLCILPTQNHTTQQGPSFELDQASLKVLAPKKDVLSGTLNRLPDHKQFTLSYTTKKESDKKQELILTADTIQQMCSEGYKQCVISKRRNPSSTKRGK
ncbi:MAG: hypothetical protein HQK51_21815 [Oligoflexia bacterium]|nr:hypothetical protein [Oligoflexia bacterium]